MSFNSSSLTLPSVTILLGTRKAATVDRARRKMPPTLKTCMAMLCAAAATPVLSRVCVARVTARKTTLRATARSWTAAPPARSGRSVLREGSARIFLSLMSLAFPRSVK